MANRMIDGTKKKPVAPTAVGVDGVRMVRAKASSGHAAPVHRPAPKASVQPSRPIKEEATKTNEELETEEDALLAAAFNEKPDKKSHKQTRADFVKPVNGFDMDLSEDEIKKDAPKKRHIVRNIVIGVLILAVIGGVVAYFWGDAIIRKLTGGRSGMGDLIGAVTSDTYVDLKKDSRGRTNILVFGTSGWTMEDETHDGAMLTDSIMAVSLDSETGDVAMVNLPRDLYLGNTCTSTGKINEVYWCNNINDTDEEGGAKALETEVSKVLGMDFQYFIHLNWGALVQIVDILDGITVTVDEDINDYGWTNIIMKAGEPTVLDGEQALGLARARHGTTSGDFTRAASQQKILIAMKDKILEKGLSITDIIGIMNSVGDNVRTDFNMDEIKSLYHTVTTIDLSTMRSISLLDQGDGTSLVTTASFDPSGLGYEVSFVVPAAGRYNYRDIQKYVDKQLSSDPVVREDPAVLVLNGTGESGVASVEKGKLEEDGFENVAVGDAPEGYWEGIKVYDASSKAPGSLAKITKKYGVEATGKVPAEVDATGYDIVIIIGVQKTSEE